jgi:uncharacterized membrane protein YebE (DUF533 family)
MSLIPSRSTSKKAQAAKAASKATKTAGKAGKKVAKAKAVQKAPKTAAAVWTGKRSGKIVKGVGIAILGAITFKALRSKLKGGASSDTPAPPTYTSTPTPDPGAPSAAVNGSAPAAGVDETTPVPDPGAPQGDPLADEAEKSSDK